MTCSSEQALSRVGSGDVEAAGVAVAGDVPVADAGRRRQGRQPLLHPRRGGRRRQYVSPSSPSSGTDLLLVSPLLISPEGI